MLFVRVKDPVKIAVYDLNPTGKKTIVLVHGWPLAASMYEYQRRFLVNCGYRVITYDLRGFGKSDAPSQGYSYDQLAGDLHCMVRYLHLRSFILAGFSMGGAIVLRYMRLFQGYGVEKLALFAAAAPRFTKAADFPLGMTLQAANALIAQAKTDRPQLCQNFSRMLLASPHSDAVKNWFRDIALSASGIGTVTTACSLRDEDGRADFKAVHVPTGIFHGKKDQVVSFELGMYQHQEIADSKLFPFENSGHAVFYDELDAFHDCLLRFLEAPASGAV